MNSRQFNRKLARENPYWPERIAKLERKAASEPKIAESEPPKRRPLGAYDVPLHLLSYTGELSPREIARLSLDHWRSMIARSNGRGFRVDPNQSPKRKRPRNPRDGAVVMIMNGLLVQARYGAEEVANAQ